MVSSSANFLEQKKVLHQKRAQSPLDFFSTQHGRHFLVLTSCEKWNFQAEPSRQMPAVKMCNLTNGREGGGLGRAWNSYWLVNSQSYRWYLQIQVQMVPTRSRLPTVVVCRYTMYSCIPGLFYVIRYVGEFFLRKVLKSPSFITIRFIWNQYSIKNNTDANDTYRKIKSVRVRM